MSGGRRAPVRLRSFDDALADAADRGLAVVLTDEAAFALAFSTPFGPCVRRHARGEGDAFLLRVLSESVGGDYAVVSVAGAQGPAAERILALPGLSVTGAPAPGPAGADAVDAALTAFAAARPAVPVHSGRGDGARARSSTVAPCQGRSYERGQVLRPSAESREGGCVIRWRRPDGGDAGIHLVLDRHPTAGELALVAAAEGSVVSVVPGAMPWRDGTRRVQTLVLDVPHAFANAFPDGRMPRHGLAGDPR